MVAPMLIELCLQNLPLPLPDKTFTNQTVVVTGSNTGLGREAALHYVRLGAARVILAVRSLPKGESAKAYIEATTSRLDVVEVWKLDMSSFSSVNAFITKARELPRLDQVVLNAGAGLTTWEVTEDGWEAGLQINALSTALLGLGLLPQLIKRAKSNKDVKPHLAIISSGTHAWAQFVERKADDILAKMNEKQHFEKNPEDRYPVTKLLDVYIMQELAGMVPRSEASGEPLVVIDAVDPGLCHSELTRHINSWTIWLLKLLFARSTEKGSRTLVQATMIGSEGHGKYLSNFKITSPGKFVTNDEGFKARKQVWAEMLEVLKKVSPGIDQINV
ncbi:hypothetical protein RUND412_006643 [Rhizina undulata]